MSLVYFLFAQTLLFAIPLMIVALGGMFSERSGVVNLALEGIMIIGGFAGVFYLNYMQSNDILHGLPLLLTGLLISGIVGILFSMLHAFAAIHLSADQTISGTALNMLAPALGIFIAKQYRMVCRMFHSLMNSEFLKFLDLAVFQYLVIYSSRTATLLHS